MKLNMIGTMLCVLIICVVSMFVLATQLPEQRRAANNTFPQWAYDGKKIACTSDRDGDPEIYRMNADGSNPVRLTHAPGRDAHPYFSQDGRKIIFQSPRANSEDTNIYVMGADGKHVNRLTNSSFIKMGPVWLPDGKKSLLHQMEMDRVRSTLGMPMG